MSGAVKFYFSFRSPYAWLGFHRLRHAARALQLDVEYVPLLPPKGFLEDMDQRKRRYIGRDVARCARAFGLELRWPQPFDTDWLPPHAAFLYAADQGRAAEFGAALYTARFGAGRDIGDREVLGEIAAQCGLGAERTAAAGADRALRARLLAGMRGVQADGVFGVPYFIHAGEAFWGNDRLEWLLRAVAEHRGQPLPDLARDPLARPF